MIDLWHHHRQMDNIGIKGSECFGISWKNNCWPDDQVWISGRLCCSCYSSCMSSLCESCLHIMFKCMHVMSSTQFTPLLSSLHKKKKTFKKTKSRQKNRNQLCDHLIMMLMCLEARAAQRAVESLRLAVGKPPTCCRAHAIFYEESRSIRAFCNKEKAGVIAFQRWHFKKTK